MKPQELFIGALCLYDTGEGIFLNVVSGYDIQDIYDDIDTAYSPIPLTPAVVGCIEGCLGQMLLELCIYSNAILGITYICDYGIKIRISDAFGSSLLNIPHIIHLHQLQHLYFALTGEEMKIDIEKLKTVV